jgi:glycosyltransferase involved in cell wall biosynthesis
MSSCGASERLRIRHYIYDDPKNPWVGGGGALRVHEIYRRLTSETEAEVVTGRYPRAGDEVEAGVHYVRRGLPRPYAVSRLSFAACASRGLRSDDYDAAFVDFSAYTWVQLPRDRPVALVLGQLVTPTARQRWGSVAGSLFSRAERRMLAAARHVVAMSRPLLDEARPYLRSDAHADVVAAAAPDELFEIERAESDYLLFLGRFDMFQKGIDTLLAAAPAILRRYPEIRLVIAGRGKDAAKIRAAISDHAPRITLIEGVDAARRAELLRGALALIVPSRFEGFGMVVAEALAAGVPVVASQLASLADILRPPAGGEVFPPDDPAALFSAVSALLDDPDRRAELSVAGRALARRFSWDVVARDHLAFARRLASA